MYNAFKHEWIYKSLNETKYMALLIKDDKLLEKYSKNWDKVSSNIKKGFDSEPVYNEKYLKTKTLMKVKSVQIFRNEGTPKEGSHCICLLVISIDSVIKIGKNYYSLVKKGD